MRCFIYITMIWGPDERVTWIREYLLNECFNVYTVSRTSPKQIVCGWWVSTFSKSSDRKKKAHSASSLPPPPGHSSHQTFTCPIQFLLLLNPTSPHPIASTFPSSREIIRLDPAFLCPQTSLTDPDSAFSDTTSPQAGGLTNYFSSLVKTFFTPKRIPLHLRLSFAQNSYLTSAFALSPNHRRFSFCDLIIPVDQ